ncbi:MAG: flavin reductase family protein [Tepidiformaceae bacterium]
MPERVRDVLSYLWSPLCAVGSHEGRRMNAQICVSVFGASIVPERPRLLVVLSKTNYTQELVEACGTLAVTVLGDAQIGLLEPLGLRSGRDGYKLGGIDHEVTGLGDPYFPGGTGYVGCEVIESTDLGDSRAFLCAVRERANLAGLPPMTWADARGVVGDEFVARWAEKSAREQSAARATMHWTEPRPPDRWDAITQR